MPELARYPASIVPADTASVYDALQLDWDPTTVGSIEDEVGNITVGEVERAILDEFSSLYEVVSGSVSSDTLALADTMASEHLAP